jgi:PAS domain-containing protein
LFGHSDRYLALHLESFVEDISERKQAERRLLFTPFAIDKTIDQAFWMTAEGRMVYVNEAACRALFPIRGRGVGGL